MELLVQSEIADVRNRECCAGCIAAGVPNHLSRRIHTGYGIALTEHVPGELTGAAANIQYGRAPLQSREEQSLQDGPRSGTILDAPEAVVEVCKGVIFAIAPNAGGTGRWQPTIMGQAMSQTITAPGTEVSVREEKVPLYRVVLLDDDDHTYDYVIEMLQKIFIFPAEQALRHAQEVDANGRTALITCELPEAEFGRDQIHAYGRDWRMPRSKGSMSAIVEPAD